MERTVSEHVAEPQHAGTLAGADRVGEASGGNRLVVQVGLWTDGDRVIRARYRASTCATLIAYAEVACALLEGGAGAAEITPGTLQRRVSGVHPGHRDRAELVAEAVRKAVPFASRSPT